MARTTTLFNEISSQIVFLFGADPASGRGEYNMITLRMLLEKPSGLL
jgi:hypothetical protein